MAEQMYSWQEFVKYFDEITKKEQYDYLVNLDEIGEADEVADMIENLWENPKAANVLLDKANKKKLVFSLDDIIEFHNFTAKTLLNQALLNSIDNISQEDIQDIYDFFGEEITIKICDKKGYLYPLEVREKLQSDYDPYENTWDKPTKPKTKVQNTSQVKSYTAPVYQTKPKKKVKRESSHFFSKFLFYNYIFWKRLLKDK